MTQSTRIALSCAPREHSLIGSGYRRYCRSKYICFDIILYVNRSDQNCFPTRFWSESDSRLSVNPLSFFVPKHAWEFRKNFPSTRLDRDTGGPPPIVQLHRCMDDRHTNALHLWCYSQQNSVLVLLCCPSLTTTSQKRRSKAFEK